MALRQELYRVMIREKPSIHAAQEPEIPPMV
jgi:hypothetical protein